MANEMVEKAMWGIAAVEGYDLDGLKAYASSSSVAKADFDKLERKARAAIDAIRDSFADPVIRNAIDAALKD